MMSHGDSCCTLYKSFNIICCCLPKGRHSEAAHEKRLLCAQKCTRGGVGHEGVGWGGSCRGGVGWVMQGWGGVVMQGVGWVTQGGVGHAGVMVWQMYFKIILKLKQVLIAMI